MIGRAKRPSRCHGAYRPARSHDPDGSHPARPARSGDRAVRPRNQADPHQTRRPDQSWPAAISPCAIASTRTPRAVSATRCWGRGWTSPYRTAGTRLSASTACPPSPRARRIPVHPGVQAQRQCGATARQRSRIRTYERAPTTASIHTTCAAHISQDCGMSGPTRAADAAGPSAGVDLQECCPYPEQVGVRVRLRVSVEHSLVATAVRGSR
jgi:hypothetical protein